MKFRHAAYLLATTALSAAIFAAGCGISSGDAVDTGSGTEINTETDIIPTESSYTSDADKIVAAQSEIKGVTSVPDSAVELNEDEDNLEITSSGEYYVTGTLKDKIEVTCEGVTLYLVDADITNNKKVIDSTCDLTITLMGENTIENSNEDGSNAIDCEGDLIINGNGSLDIYATKNGIKANSITVVDASLTIKSEKDGIHAEVEDYDGAETEPEPSYDDGGYVYIEDANVDIDAEDDGIQADTFVYIVSGTINITAGGGAPDTVTVTSSDNASGKGIKAGLIDWGNNGTDLEWDGYLVYISGGTITIDSNDDALHSNYEMIVTGGEISLSSGDDAMHADELLQIKDADIDVYKCYEGIEAAKVEILGGTIEIETYEDGINAADGTSTSNTLASYNANCHIIIAGGYVSVNCIGSEGDAIDSNGSLRIYGGELYIAGSSNSADNALDADGDILINGGYVFAAGSQGMLDTPSSSSTQYCVSYTSGSGISAGTTLYLCDSDGNIIMYYTAPRACASFIISCPEFERGKTYSLYAGSTLLTSFTISSTITTVISNSSISNPSGTPGGVSPGSNTPGFSGGFSSGFNSGMRR